MQSAAESCASCCCGLESAKNLGLSVVLCANAISDNLLTMVIYNYIPVTNPMALVESGCGSRLTSILCIHKHPPQLKSRAFEADVEEQLLIVALSFCIEL